MDLSHRRRKLSHSLRLIRKVEQYPILYNRRVGPKERAKREFLVNEAWSKISHALGMKKEACRYKWYCIRGYYASCVKSGSRRSRLAGALDFLKPFMNRKVKKKSIPDNIGSRRKLKIEREMEISLQEAVQMFAKMNSNMQTETKMRIGIVKEENTYKNQQEEKPDRRMPKWTETQKRHFIQTVQEYNVVYDKSGTLEEEDEAWIEIAEINNTTPSICRRKWRWLRVTFCRALGNQEEFKKYRFYNDLKFLEPYVDPVIKKSNIYSSSDSEDNSSSDEDF